MFEVIGERINTSRKRVQPISTDAGKGMMVLDAVRAIKAEFPEVHITGGLS